MAKKEQLDYQIGDVYDESFVDLNPNAINDTMESIAYSVVEGGYSKTLTKKDLIEKRELLADVSIEIAEIEVQKKEAMNAFKIQLEEPNKQKAELLNQIKYKTEFKNGTLFNIDNQEQGKMYVFDDQAVCIEIRDLRSSEKQTRIKILKTGTDE
jgi:hypothetical protein